MLWIVAFLAALLGALIANEGSALFGFLSSFLLVAALGLVRRQSRRIDRLRVDLERLSARMPSATTSPSAEPTPGPQAIAEEPPPLTDTLFERASPIVSPMPLAVSPPADGSPAATPSAADAPPVGAQPKAADVAPSAEASSWGERLRALLFEGNLPVKLGLVVSLFGVGALLRYAASVGMFDIPLAWRYAGVAVAAMALLGYGLRQAPLRPAFGLSLQGGAIGVLLLTVFGSFRVPDLLPAGLAFGLVLTLVAGAAVLAIRQNAVWLAVIGFLGGYLAPILLSTGSGNHVALFSYYALLNVAVFAMAWVRPWRSLNLLGFVFTFGVGAIWGTRYFQPEMFATTEPFLVAFFLMYVTIPVLYAIKGRTPGRVDATLLFGTPLIAFPMQVGLLDGERMPLAFSALAVGAVYLGLALWARREDRLRVLAQSAAALGLAFATLAVPLALSARWTSATWALQGVALLWLGQTQQRRWPQVAGVSLQVLAGFAYLLSADHGPDAHPIANPETLNLALLVLAAGGCAWLFDRRQAPKDSVGGALMAVPATIWWVWAGYREIERNLEGPDLAVASAWVAFAGLSSALAALLMARSGWRRPAWWPALFMPSAVLAVALMALATPSPFKHAQGLVLAVLALGLFTALPWLRATPKRLAASHIGGLAALTLGLGLAIDGALDSLQSEQLGLGWRLVVPWVPLAALAALLARSPRWAAWPVGDAITSYRGLALGLSTAVLGTLWLGLLWVHGDAAPLPWLPLLNPVELFQLAGLAGLTLWLRGRNGGAALGGLPMAGLATLAFAFLSMATLRTCLHTIEPVAALDVFDLVPDWWAIASRPASQAALSVAWSVAGVMCWVVGSHRMHRGLWTCGATLLGLVLLKLLLIDRTNLGDLMGIVSFLVVGGLLVVVGRIAPRPPSRERVMP